ncbi:hypothetical protein [Cellulomonas soli]|uniref:hypothetical protein n=1 Tax=Cellulomonas soli TaxID=931535 RepID=UPI003F879BF4
MTRPGTPAADTEPDWVTWTIDDGFAARLARARLRLEGIVLIIPASMLLLVGLIVGLVLQAWFVPVLAVLASALVVPLFVLRQRSKARRTHPVGTVLRSCVTMDELLLEGPRGTSRVGHRLVRSVRRWGDMVVVRFANGVHEVIPVELLGEDGAALLARRAGHKPHKPRTPRQPGAGAGPAGGSAPPG